MIIFKITNLSIFFYKTAASYAVYKESNYLPNTEMPIKIHDWSWYDRTPGCSTDMSFLGRTHHKP